MNDKPIILGKYSPSQNGIVVNPKGIALCLAGGGNGHDTDKPKILIEYDDQFVPYYLCGPQDDNRRKMAIPSEHLRTGYCKLPDSEDVEGCVD